MGENILSGCTQTEQLLEGSKKERKERRGEERTPEIIFSILLNDG